MALESPDLRLYICGDGDSRDEIMRLSCFDKRIVYKGQVKRSEAFQLQKNALLLINTRTPEGEFTKYSFPSKVMEYLASGTPTLMYRLPGIPEEYYEYCYSLSRADIDSLSQMLTEILNLSESERIAKGQAAREFILKNKNPKSQTLKIINLLGRI